MYTKTDRHQPAQSGDSLFHSLFFLAAGIITGLFSNGRWIIPVAAWIAPVFMLRFTRKTNRTGLAIGFICLVASSFFMYDSVIPLHGAPFFLTVTGIGVFFYLPYLADKFLSRHLSGIVATLPFPLVWVIVEYISSVSNPYGTWASIAYTQYSCQTLIQTASLIGTGGIVFLVTWFAPVVLDAFDHGHISGMVRRPILLYATVLGTMLFYGGARIWFSSGQVPTVRISGIAAPPATSTDPYDYYLEQTAVEALAGARIVIWPEGAVTLKYGTDETRYLNRCMQTAKIQNIYIAASVLISGKIPDLYENKLVLINPEGNIVGTYLKSRPVPGEPSVRGSGQIPVFRTPYGRIALAICFDLDFPDLIRQAGTAGADILLVPGNDWKAIDPLHTHMAVFRAIENGCALVRITGIGRSAAADCRGSVLAQTDSFTSGNSSLTASVPITGCSTVYARTGNLFSISCISALILLFILAVHKKKH